MLQVAVLTVSLGSPGLPPVASDFAPVRADVTADDETLEILAFDVHGDMVGALIASPAEANVRIDASFSDGYASIALELGPHEVLTQNVQTDIDPRVAAARLSRMFGFVQAPVSGPFEASKKECILLFAGVAGTCGLAATLTPLNIFAAWGCVSGFATSLCACADYLPIKIC